MVANNNNSNTIEIINQESLQATIMMPTPSKSNNTNNNNNNNPPRTPSSINSNASPSSRTNNRPSGGSLGGSLTGSQHSQTNSNSSRGGHQSSPEGRSLSRPNSIDAGGGTCGSKDSREPPSLGSIQNIKPAGSNLGQQGGGSHLLASGSNIGLSTSTSADLPSPQSNKQHSTSSSVGKTTATLIPKNPKDTAAYINNSPITNNISGSGAPNNLTDTSPKRRLKGTSLDFGGPPLTSPGGGHSSGAAFAGSGGGSVRPTSGGSSIGANSYGQSGGGGKSVKSVPTTYGSNSNAYNAVGGGQRIVPPRTPNQSQPQTPGSVASLHSMKDISIKSTSLSSSLPNTSSGGRGVGLNNSMPTVTQGGNNNVRQTGLDDEEQYMFEQRLTQDELGVAIRKISHSGKAQLRYVKCIPLRPPSSSDFDITDRGSSGGPPLTLTNVSRANSLNAVTTNSVGIPSDSISVSSKSSTGSRFLERMRSTTASGVIRNQSGRLLKALPGSVGALSTSAADAARGSGGNDDCDNPLLQENNDKKSNRALTWGKKNAVTLSLDKFTCVKKGKCTERTIRNSSPSNRLLSIMCINDVRGTSSESLDIEAPTKLDRDKFASAFAKFLGVPLLEEEDSGEKGGDNVVERGRVGNIHEQYHECLATR